MNRPAAALPLISIILPVHDVAGHVGACIDSLRAQTLEDFECLVIDDGSTDDSAARAADAMGDDPRFTLIRQDNRGLSGARNTGLDRARGAFVAFVDSDDRVMPDYLMQLWRALEETGCDWVACAVRYCLPDGTGSTHSAIHGAADLTGHTVARRYRLDDWSDVIRHFPSAWNKLYRASLIRGLRFDDGTWFEDHGFFQRAALRTDHLLHLPQALYLQTQGRAGQITGSDDDRVFQQFDVLSAMGATMRQSDRPGADTGFARIASRLLYERSTALRDPGRRARFAAEAAAFLAREGIVYCPDWDRDISLSWAMEMAGDLPLSVVIPWSGDDILPLQKTLGDLAAAHGPAHEVLVVCDTPDAAARARDNGLPDAQILVQPGRGAARARNHGLARARGAYVVFLRPGDRLHPAALSAWCDGMLRADADVGMSVFRGGTEPDAPVHSGFLDHSLLPGGQAPHKEIAVTPMLALSLDTELSAKIFKRRFVQEQALSFAPGVPSGQAFCLTAALTAGRVAYVPWAGLAVADAGPRHIGPLALWRRHGALLRALPDAVTLRLPDGWQRRLFARGLRDQVQRAGTAPRLTRAVMLAGSALAALRYRVAGQAGSPAGLDPSVGPRLSLMLDPPELIRRSIAARGIDTASRAARPPVRDDPRIFSFAVGARGVFRFRADFHDTPDVPYANLSFLDEGGGRIPFHLSLRRDEGLVVCNDWNGVWGAERQTPLIFDPAGTEVTIVLTPPHVEVWVEGARLFRFGRPWLRRRSGFRNLDTITALEVQGGIRPCEILPRMPQTGQIFLDGRLQLCVGLSPGDRGGDMRLCCSENGAQTGVFAMADGTGAIAILHGHLWQGLPAEAPLRLSLDAPGRAPRTFEIGRAEMTDRLGALLASGLSHSDTTLALCVLEHLRHGGFLSALTPALQDRAQALARNFGLRGFLDPVNGAQDGDLSPPPNGDRDRGELDTALAQFIHGQRQTPTPDPLAVLRGLALPPVARRGLFFALSEYFTMPGQDFDGFALMAQKAGVLAQDLPQDRWSLSAMLPLLLWAGRIDDLRGALTRLAEPGAGWVLTPPLAWVAQRAMTDERLSEPDRENILWSVMGFVDNRRADYWDRIHCRELTRSAVAMLAYHSRASDWMQRDIVDFCLRAYGLSRVFWQMVQESGTVLPPRIALAAARFSDIAAERAPGDAERALPLFAAVRCADAPRLRREFQGPVPQATDLIETGSDPAQDALRHMAFPGSAPVSRAVSDMVGRALPSLYPQVPQAPNFDLQCAVGKDMAAFLACPDTPPDTAKLDDLMGRLTLLSSAQSGFLGFGLALALITGLGGHRGQADTVARLRGWLSVRRDALPAAHRQAFHGAPALRLPLAALRDSGLPQARAVLDMLAPPGGLPASGPADNGGLPAPAPLFDAIVTVFSCLPHLDTRIPAMRTGWLSLLLGLGIPYVVMVGDGDGQRRGDVVHLDAPDDYEGLPLKTLAALRWVHDNTRFAHMIKIDDDCFLNAPLFFQSLSYRKFDYYGRCLIRTPGQMDRAWHQEKSSSDRARLLLDKSPEPSQYADGGSAYALSRTAMAAALEVAASEDGRQLIELSFMEDKLLGDLLALRGIHVAEEDYRVSIRRRTHRAALPVAAWHNSFFAGPTAPLQMVHLDNHGDQARAMDRLKTPGLWPRKIWPTWQKVKLGYQSNALELVSDDSTVARARDADVAVVACMRNEMFMLPHFLAHYRRLGVGSFLIADNCSDDGTLEYLAEQPDVALFSVDTDYRLSHYGVAWQQALLAAFRMGKWALVADADELLVWQRDQRETLPALLARPEFANAEAVRLFMLDMYPEGSLSEATFASGDPFGEAGFADRIPFLTSAPMRGPFSDQPAFTSALRHRLIPGSRPNLFTAQKLALLRYHPFMRLSEGMHFVGDVRLAPRDLIFAHFKYNADFRRKARTEVARRQHFNDAEEYRKYLALASEGRDVIHDPDLSVRWYDSPFVRARLDGDQAE